MNSETCYHVLNHYGAKLYHAHYLHDARAYIRNNGILSREHLLNERGIVDFYTDEDDRRLGVLDRVFFNLRDQGSAARKGNGIPNVYGPVQFIYSINVLTRYDNITILPYPVSQQVEHGCNRLFELYTEHGVRSLYRNDKNWLVQEYDDAEVLIDDNKVSFEDLDMVVVDGVIYNNNSLLDIVREEVRAVRPKVKVYGRIYKDNGEVVTQALVDWVAQTEGELDQREGPPQVLHSLYQRQVEIGRIGALRTWGQRMWNNVLLAM